MFNQALKESLIEQIKPNDLIYNYSNIILYHEKTRNPTMGFMDFPSHEEIMIKVDKILSEELNLIEERLRKNVHPVSALNKMPYVKFVGYIKENICVNLTDKILALPVYDDQYDVPEWDEETLVSLDSLVIDKNKSVLENLHRIMISNNLVMKNIIPCMILGNLKFKIDYDHVYDSTLNFIEFIINYIYTQGIDFDDMNEDNSIPLLIVNELAEEKDVDIEMVSNTDLQNLIMIIIYNARYTSNNFLDYIFMKNTEIIRRINKNIYPNGRNNIDSDSFDTGEQIDSEN